MIKLAKLSMVAASLALSACGGGGTGTGGGATSYAAELASLQSSIDTFTFTPQAALPSGSATYRGVAAFNTTDLSSIDPSTADPTTIANAIEGYYGALTLNVDFGGGVTGSVRNFEDFNGGSASGQLAIQGGVVTAANNASIGGGYSAIATGPIDGESYTFDVEGNFIGDNGEGVSIYFDGDDAIGTGFAAR